MDASEHYFRGNEDSFFPLVALVDDGEALTLFAVSVLPPTKLAEAAIGSSTPHDVDAKPSTLVNHNVGVFGRCSAWDEKSLTLEARQFKKERGFDVDVGNDRHSVLLATEELVAVPKKDFVRACDALLRASHKTANQRFDEALEYEIYAISIEDDGMHNTPFFELVFGKTPSDYYGALS